MVKSWSCVRFQARCEAVVRREAEVGAAEIHDGKRVTTNDESVETPGKTGWTCSNPYAGAGADCLEHSVHRFDLFGKKSRSIFHATASGKTHGVSKEKMCSLITSLHLSCDLLCVCWGFGGSYKEQGWTTTGDVEDQGWAFRARREVAATWWPELFGRVGKVSGFIF